MHYEELNFQQLSWNYWHAMFSPKHAKPVLLGACIEAIEKNYRELGKYNSKLLDKKNAGYLRNGFLEIVKSMSLGEKEKEALLNKASDLNNPPRRILNERFFLSLSLEMGDKEKKSWESRNDAAHGRDKTQGKLKTLMEDISLLKNILHRIVISIADASNQYIDCYTPGYPIRQLNESIESPIRSYFER